MQDDVLAIVDASNNVVGSYTYDAWGKVLSVTGTIAEINPIRYRGYYYDTETGLYYLNSRYYDPEIGRFVNADNADVLRDDPKTLLHNNLFAYCENNPVHREDVKGDRWKWKNVFTGIAIIAGVVAIGTLCVASAGIAAPAFAVIGGGVISGMSAGTISTLMIVSRISLYIAIDSSVAAGVAAYSSRTSADPFARPGQKKQGRERKSKARQSKDWKSRSKPKPPKKHTPGRDHRKEFK